VQTISRLLDRGIKLNGIKELLAAWDRGDDLGHILGVAEPDATQADVASSGDTIAATELEQRYRDVPNGLARVVSAGLYEPVDAATYRIVDRQLIRIFDQLVGAGIPADELLGELEKLRADCDRIARRFVDLFHRTVWEPFQRSERTPTDLAERVAAARDCPGQATAELVNRFVARYLEQDTELAEALPDA